MDIRRSINTKLWSDEWVEKLNPTEKLLWIYLLTNPQTNMLGIYEISIKRISFDTGLKVDSIENTLKAFERVKKAFYFKGHIILTNWIKNQSMNPNMVKSAEQLYSRLSNDLIEKLLEYGLESFESLSKGLEYLPNGSEKGKGKGKEIEYTADILFSDCGWSNDPELLDKLKSKYPKLFTLKYPLKHNEHIELVKDWTAEKVRDIYSEMQNYAKLESKSESANLTARNWLTRNKKREAANVR